MKNIVRFWYYRMKDYDLDYITSGRDNTVLFRYCDVTDA